MVSTRIVVAALAAVTVLAGCMPAPERPQPATEEEIEALQQEQARVWWQGIAQGKPMPEVAVVEELPAEEAYERQTQCLDEAALPGVTVGTAGQWTYSGDAGPDDEEYLVVQQQYWICTQQFPAAVEDEFVLSRSELAWLYDYYVQRYEPCLASLGFEATAFPSRQTFVGEEAAGYPSWVPHDFSVIPVPTLQEWRLLAAKCPLPYLLEPYDLPGNVSSS